jgi:hypothetical protein
MNRINSAVLQQFSRKGLVINEGVAVDAGLVLSAERDKNSLLGGQRLPGKP